MSAMFDDWAYQSVFDPPSPPAPVQKRLRAVSIVKSVAQTPQVPEPQVRPRAASIQLDQSPHGDEINPKPAILEDTPVSKSLDKQTWDIDSWLGSLSPHTFDFDAQLWTSQVSSFISARDQAEYASLLVTEARTAAHGLSREVDWLISELQDTREHDLKPLNDALAKRQAVSAQLMEANAVKHAIAVVWDAQDRIARELRGPAPKAVPKLGEIMGDIDAALQFCNEHPDFQGIEQAVLVLRSSAQRALAIAGAFIAHELMRVSSRVAKRLSESKSASLTTKHAFIYGKFGSDLAKIIPVVSLLRQHEAQQHWADTQQQYFRARESLIGSELASYAQPITAFASFNDELMETLHTVFVRYRQVFVQEQQLYEQLFGSLTPEFWSWLQEDVSDPLTSAIRRIVVHETDISKLGQLISLIYMEEEDPEGNAGDNDALSVMNHSIVPSIASLSIRKPEVRSENMHSVSGEAASREAANDVASPAPLSSGPAPTDPFNLIYQDAQNRLIFRANLAIDNLSSYEPSGKDMLRAKYPTVDQALKLLGQVYRLLNSRVFNDLAHRCIRECLLSLDSAVANKMVSASGEETVRIHLFHIKQLLILQAQIVDFDLRNTVIQEVDFSGIQRLLSRDSRSNASFRDLITLAWDSVPRVVEIMFDAMEELYANLRRAVDRMCAAFVARVAPPLATKNSAEFRYLLLEEFKSLKKSVNEYISDTEVTHFLVDSAQEAVMDRYTEFYRSLAQEELSDENLMDIDTMASWLSATIREA